MASHRGRRRGITDDADSPVWPGLGGGCHGHEVAAGPGVARGAEDVACDLRPLGEAAQVVAEVERNEVL